MRVPNNLAVGGVHTEGQRRGEQRAARRVAVIGAGISGLGAAWQLSTTEAQSHGIRVTVFEAAHRAGGHANTVDVSLPSALQPGHEVQHGVDTGFLVLNERTYPKLLALFKTLGVDVVPSDMSFSVKAERSSGGWLEWSGSNLNTVFAQRRNLASLRFARMLLDVLRFNRLCTRLARRDDEQALQEPFGDFLRRHGFGDAFRDDYALPMIACIWSCPEEQMLAFPTATLIRFCHNHGLLQINDRPQWLTVRGGSREYVRRMTSHLRDLRLSARVESVSTNGTGWCVETAEQREHFDAVIFACHAPQTRRMLVEGLKKQPNAMAAHATLLLSGLRTQRNRAVLHTDAGVMPKRRGAWAAWNFERVATAATNPATDRHQRPVCLHYWINRLQPLPFATDVFVSLNPIANPAPERVLQTFDYEHPVFDAASLDAGKRLEAIQGVGAAWFAGAWTGYGFHEDGLASGMRAGDGLLASLGNPAGVGAAQASLPARQP